MPGRNDWTYRSKIVELFSNLDPQVPDTDLRITGKRPQRCDEFTLNVSCADVTIRQWRGMVPILIGDPRQWLLQQEERALSVTQAKSSVTPVGKLLVWLPHGYQLRNFTLEIQLGGEVIMEDLKLADTEVKIVHPGRSLSLQAGQLLGLKSFELTAAGGRVDIKYLDAARFVMFLEPATALILHDGNTRKAEFHWGPANVVALGGKLNAYQWTPIL
jgi:hypothetical protein